MRRAVRAIVIRDGYLLVIHRNKFGHEYYTLPGGGITVGETAEQALFREMSEETGIAISQPHLVIVEDAGVPFGIQYHYLCDYSGGEPGLHPDSIESKITAMGKNLYTPMWLSLQELDRVAFKSTQLRDTLKRCLQEGFRREPIEIHSA